MSDFLRMFSFMFLRFRRRKVSAYYILMEFLEIGKEGLIKSPDNDDSRNYDHPSTQCQFLEIWARDQAVPVHVSSCTLKSVSIAIECCRNHYSRYFRFPVRVFFLSTILKFQLRCTLTFKVIQIFWTVQWNHVLDPQKLCQLLFIMERESQASWRLPYKVCININASIYHSRIQFPCWDFPIMKMIASSVLKNKTAVCNFNSIFRPELKFSHQTSRGLM